MATDFDGAALRKRLDLVIVLLLELVPGGAATTSRKIDRLLELGCTPSETAQILGKPTKYVTSQTAHKKSPKKVKKTPPEAPAGGAT